MIPNPQFRIGQLAICCFFELLSGSNITVFADTKQHIHAIRLLRNYLSGYPLNIIHHSNNTTSNVLQDHNPIFYDNGLVFILTEDLHSLPRHIYQNRRVTPLIEGAFVIKTERINQASVVIIAGGKTSGVIYAINELGTQYLDANNKKEIPTLDIYQAPSLPYRLFWTWDHSTNWYLGNAGMQEIGFANPYLKPEGGFLEDYHRVVDFMSLNRLNGLVIYGFLRDSHGGISAAKELCQYANERGVRIIPGVGINVYGGIYWEGDHPYNLSNWLTKHPELSATFNKLKTFELPDFEKLHIPKTHYLDAACPSKQENVDFHVEAIQWLAKTFDIGGINFETGDYGTCQCATCAVRRDFNKQWAHEDMASLYPRLFAAAKQNKEDLWLICEAYWDNILNLDAVAPLKNMPNDAIFQYCTNRGYLEKVKKEITKEHVSKLPGSKNILRTHMGSQWQQERYVLVAERYAEMMKIAHKTGILGATIFGEAGAFNVVNEINYLAFARFGYNANLTWEAFITRDLSPLFGGKRQAEQYLKLLTSANHQNKTVLEEMITVARELGSETKGECYRRWVWLQNHLFQKLKMHSLQKSYL